MVAVALLHQFRVGGPKRSFRGISGRLLRDLSVGSEYQDMANLEKTYNVLEGFNGVAWRGPELMYLPEEVSGHGCTWGYLHPQNQADLGNHPRSSLFLHAISAKIDFPASSDKATGSLGSADPLKQIPCICSF